VECAGCATIFQNPRVRDEDLPLCYPDGYYTRAAEPWSPAPAPPGSLRAGLRRAIRHAADGSRDRPSSRLLRSAGRLLARSPHLRTRARFGLVDPLAPPPRGGRCLEVGPGQGVDLARLRLLGWDACGLEMDPVAAERARLTSGCEVRVGTLSSTDYPRRHFDLVYMSHVLEHLPDPSGSLRRCLELLAPGGRLVLEYPNPQALSARWYGPLSPVWDPPRHLILPPVAAIVPLVTGIGFVDVSARTLAGQGAVDAEAARRRRRGERWDPASPTSPGPLARAFALAESLLVALGCPVGEEVLVVARKPRPSGP
jgi:SAM-dependent methyltransferase